MQIKHTFPGDIIRIPRISKTEEKEVGFHDTEWRVERCFDHMVLTTSVKCPWIRRCFSYGDLVILGLEDSVIKK